MKTRIVIALLLFVFGIFFQAGAQNWIAEIRVNINHGSYAIEKISGTISYSGIVYNLAETTAPADIQIAGTGNSNGQLVINLSGKAMFPYPNQNPLPPDNLDLSASYIGNHNTFDCLTVLFANNNGVGSFDGHIRLIPRTTITAPNAPMNCDDGSFPLTASSCASNTFEWKIGSTDIGPFTVIPGQTASALNITRAMLSNLGFGSNNQIYVIATGVEGTTSSPKLVQVYSPASQVVATAVQPICHDGTGSVSVVITPSHAGITKFDVSLYDQQFNGSALSPQIDDAPKIFNYPNVPIGTWWITVRNDTDINTFGNCVTARIPVTGTINNPPQITVQLSVSSSISCKDAADGVIHATFPLAAEPIKTFIWTGPGEASGKDIIKCAPGNYSLSIVDNNNCPGSTNSPLSLGEPSLFSITLSPTQITCFGDANGSIISNPIGGSGGPYTYSWSNGAITQNVAGLTPGKYVVNAHNGKGCSAKDSTSITQPDQIVFDIDQGHGIDCPGSQTGILSVGEIAPIAQYTYLWTSPYVSGDEQTASTLYNKHAGLYTVTVRNSSTGCTANDSHTLDDAPPFSVQITPTSNYNGSRISCNGESDGELHAQLYDNFAAEANAVSYEWKRNGVNHSNGQDALGLNAAAYTVIATYGQNCTATSISYNLQQPTPVVAQIVPSSNYNGHYITCPGADDGALLATASGGTPGGYTYQWTDGPAMQNFNNLTAGTYFVTAYDKNGCSAANSYQLNDPPPIVPEITVVSNYHGQAITCAGASDATLSASATLGGAAPYVFKWSNGSTGEIVSNLSAGQYSVEATDANQCKVQTQPIHLIDPEPVNASITILSNYNGQAIQCFDSATGSIRANGEGGTNAYSYVWSTNAITRDISGLIHGNYSVLVSDENGCSSLAAIDLLNPDPVVATISDHSDFHGFGVQCNGSQNGFIEVSGAGGTNSFTFDWPSLAQTTNRVEGLGVGQYNVTVTDENGCSDNEMFELTQPPLLTLGEISHTDINCFGGNDGALSVVSTGGAGTHEYSLNNSPWQLLPDFAGLVAEVPYVVTVKDVNLCQETFETQLAQPGEIQIQFSVQPSLCADPVGEASAAVSGGVGDFTYQWKDENENVISIYPAITKQYAGIYKLLVHDSHACPMEQAVGIHSIDGPQIQVVETRQTSCFDSADGYARIQVVDGNGPFVFSWDTGSGDVEVNNLPNGIHYASVTDANNCAAVIPVITISPEPIDVGLVGKIDASCYLSCDGSIELNPTGGNGEYTFSWNNIPGNAAIENLCSGLYNVDVTDKLGCTASQVFNIAQPDRVELRVVNRTLPSCNGGCNGAIEVVATGGSGSYTYSWNSGAQSQVQQNVCSGNYTVTATDSKNCVVSRAFDLGEPTKVQIALIENKSPTCFNGCDGKIAVTANGGVGNHRFAWADGSTLPTNSSLCVGENQVTVIDGNNCSVTEKYTITNVPQLKIDLGGGVVVCEGQQHELDAGSSWKKVEWRTGGVWISSSQSIMISNAGTYDVKVEDANNCIATDTFVLETSEDLLQASFIITAQAVVNDTIVMIDISWPLPDNITWKFPKQMEKLFDNGDVIHAKFAEAGDYDIVLNAALGECRDQMTKTITILEDEKKSSGGRLGVEDFVKTFTLHPNPNTGTFEVEVEFSHESPVTMTIWNLGTTRLVSKTSDDGNSQYKKRFDLQPITSGTYLLRVDYDGGHRTIRFLVY